MRTGSECVLFVVMEVKNWGRRLQTTLVASMCCFSTLKMESVRSLETLIKFYQDGRRLHNHRRGNFIYHGLKRVFKFPDGELKFRLMKHKFSSAFCCLSAKCHVEFGIRGKTCYILNRHIYHYLKQVRKCKISVENVLKLNL
jgi:hypothetical protein